MLNGISGPFPAAASVLQRDQRSLEGGHSGHPARDVDRTELRFRIWWDLVKTVTQRVLTLQIGS
jgi:hypothetical protein